MKADVNLVQNYVDFYRRQISQKGIPIEYIMVFEGEAKKLELMSTHEGRVYINTRLDFTIGKLEQAVLHELGHRAVEVINPYLEKGLRNFLNKYGTQIMKQEDDVHESLAEVFANYIFPEFCELDFEVIEYIERENKKSLGEFVSYEHFIREYLDSGFDKFRELLKYLPDGNSRSANFMSELLRNFKTHRL